VNVTPGRGIPIRVSFGDEPAQDHGYKHAFVRLGSVQHRSDLHSSHWYLEAALKMLIYMAEQRHLEPTRWAGAARRGRRSRTRQTSAMAKPALHSSPHTLPAGGRCGLAAESARQARPSKPGPTESANSRQSASSLGRRHREAVAGGPPASSLRRPTGRRSRARRRWPRRRSRAVSWRRRRPAPPQGPARCPGVLCERRARSRGPAVDARRPARVRRGRRSRGPTRSTGRSSDHGAAA
jgi:hypothetical protein